MTTNASSKKTAIRTERDPLLPSQSKKSVSIYIPEDEVNESPFIDTSGELPSAPLPAVSTDSEGFRGGIALMIFITFLSSVVFSIILPSMFQYIAFIMGTAPDEKNGKLMGLLGWAVCVNSLGSFLSSPLFGWWSDRRGTREVIAFSLIVMIGGNLLYSMCYLIKAFPAEYALIVSRFIVGIAAGNYAVAQTYLAYATNVNNRTLVMSLNSGASILGFIIGPAFSCLLGLKALQIDSRGILVNVNTSPGYLSAIFSLIGLFSLVFLKEIPRERRGGKTARKSEEKPAQIVSHTNHGSRSILDPNANGSKKAVGSGFYSGGGTIKSFSEIVKLAKEDKTLPWLGILSALFLYFIYTAAFTVFETIGTPYTKQYGWGTDQNSYMYMALGGICVVAIISLQFLLKVVPERIVLLGFTMLSTVGFGILVNPGGSQYGNHWVAIPRFAGGVAMISASYAVGVALIISIYTKVIQGHDQGMLNGWLSSAGAIARMVGPPAASNIMGYLGPLWIFVAMGSSMIIATICILVAYKRLKAPEDEYSVING